MPKVIVLTLWSSGLSTILAGINILGGYSDRKEMLVSYLFIGDATTGDKITLHNLSKNAVTIEHWELLWVTKKFFLFNKIVPIDIFDHEDGHLDLAANSMQSLNFNGQYHFNWNPEIENNVRLFIKLRIAGRKKFLMKLVYPRVDPDLKMHIGSPTMANTKLH
jgi:hypothetical protein